ncbi:MAG TPA: DNA repair protein RecO [Bryobacteraceae bacterium]|nr:DNA repair protein RecO [Bryobacteraceae bacterium]
MPARVSESFVLRTYPFREADLVVSFFTRDLGKLRGVARRARRPKSAFGSGLERLSRVRMAYFQKETAELVSLSGCELIESQFALQTDYALSMALDYFTEVTEQLLPPHEPNERFFRLLAAALAYLRDAADAGDPNNETRAPRMWTAVTYVSIWAVRLAGIWPEFRVSRESVEIAEEMFTTPIGRLAPREWTKTTASDLRHMLQRTMEQHAERKFMTVPLLEGL